jgi:hypothetical protein
VARKNILALHYPHLCGVAQTVGLHYTRFHGKSRRRSEANQKHKRRVAAGGDRFVAQVVLFDPGDAVPAQRRRVVPNERFRSRVAGLREQCGTQTQDKIRRSRSPVGQMRKRFRATGQ